MKRRSLILLVLLMPLCGMSEVDDFLEKPRTIFDLEVDKIHRKYDQYVENAGRVYLKMLDRVVRYMERTGDEFGIRPAQQEMQRFKEEGTVPLEASAGTPVMIVKAQTMYHESVVKRDSDRQKDFETLSEKYLGRLKMVRDKMQRAGQKGAVAAVDAEILRVQELLGEPDAAEAEAAARAVKLPASLVKNLDLVYLFHKMRENHMPDLSGRRRHGEILGAKKVEQEGITALRFSGNSDMLQIKEAPEGFYWTLHLHVYFPSEARARPRVLVSHGFRQHHVAVDASGELGVEVGSFSGCGYNVTGEKGWRRLIVTASPRGTAFYLDGKKVGATKAVCDKPIQVVGNSATGAKPWGGALGAVFLWHSTMSSERVAELDRYLKQ